MDGGELETVGSSRREVLRRAAVMGGLAWTAPVLLGVTTSPAGATGTPPPEGRCPPGQDVVVVRGCVKWDVGGAAWGPAGPKDLVCFPGADESGVADVVSALNAFGIPTWTPDPTDPNEATEVVVTLPPDAALTGAAYAFKASGSECRTDGITVDGNRIVFSAGTQGISNIKLCVSVEICR